MFVISADIFHSKLESVRYKKRIISQQVVMYVFTTLVFVMNAFVFQRLPRDMMSAVEIVNNNYKTPGKLLPAAVMFHCSQSGIVLRSALIKISFLCA